MADVTQQRLQSLVIFDRPMTAHELQLKNAIEHDPRVVVTKLQVRRPMKTDKWPRYRGHYGQMHLLILLFDFVCPCGGTRREMFRVSMQWKQPDKHERLCERLKQYTFAHLQEEGFI